MHFNSKGAEYDAGLMRHFFARIIQTDIEKATKDEQEEKPPKEAKPLNKNAGEFIPGNFAPPDDNFGAYTPPGSFLIMAKANFKPVLTAHIAYFVVNIILFGNS